VLLPTSATRSEAAASTQVSKADASASARRCAKRFGPYRGGKWPPACWRPYSPKSPFNRPIPGNPRLHPNSGAIVKRLLGWGPAQTLVAGHADSNEDYSHPIYYARKSSPVYTVRCIRWRSQCEVHGDRVRIPGKAKPANSGDGHLAVIDQRSGVEYDFWQVRSKPPGGGVLVVSHGGKTRIDRKGLGSSATAARFGLAAGIIRGKEMLAGKINHALFSAIKCTSGSSVYPAARGTSAASCGNFGLSNRNAPPLGARFWLAMPKAKIRALPLPKWQKTILRAMAKYGVLVGDTMNGNSSWGLQAESGASYTSFGYRDPWEKVGRRAGAPSDSGGYYFDFARSVDWRRYLRVVAPCVSRRGCQR
jgi:hypothetical protein